MSVTLYLLDYDFEDTCPSRRTSDDRKLLSSASPMCGYRDLILSHTAFPQLPSPGASAKPPPHGCGPQYRYHYIVPEPRALAWLSDSYVRGARDVYARCAYQLISVPRSSYHNPTHPPSSSEAGSTSKIAPYRRAYLFLSTRR